MPDRYTDIIPPDSDIILDGDPQILGMNSRLAPEQIPAGIAQYLQNIRLDTYTPTVRLGMSKQTNAIAPTSAPLIIPFTVGTSATIAGASTDGIFATCIYSDPSNSNQNYIFAATGQRCYAFNTSTKGVSSISYPANESVETVDPSTDIFQVGNNVYILRGDVGTSFTVSTLTSSGTTATLKTSVSHGLSTGNYVRVGGATQVPYNGDFSIAVTGASTFTYTISGTTTSPATGSITLNRLKTPMVWNGVWGSSFTLTSYGVYSGNFYYMPTSDWGVLHQNRVILEYSRNQIIMSNIAGPERYDVINGIFSFAPGTADYLMGAAPYQNTQLLVFNRYSVWLVNYVNGDVAAMTNQLISNTVGCISRHSIIPCGSDILFLNERGVYRLQPGLELLLRGNVLPLSADIDATIKQINFSAINTPYAAYFRNRYYLAVPVNGATRNNAILIYNFINEKWESVDALPNGFYCDEMQVAVNASGVPTLYLISYEGGIYAYEQNEADDFAAASQPPTQYPIMAQVKTRRYIFGTQMLKKFNRTTVHGSVDASSDLTVSATLINPESSRMVVTLGPYGSSMTFTRPAPINKRAYGLELTMTNTTGRFVITNISVSAYVKDRKSTLTT